MINHWCKQDPILEPEQRASDSVKAGAYIIDVHAEVASTVRCIVEEACKIFEGLHYLEVACIIKPYLVTFISLFGACASVAALSLGKKLHSDIIIARYNLNIIVESAIVLCMLVQNNVSWNSMLMVYYIQCIDGKTFKHYRQMQQKGIRRNDVTFVNMFSSIKDSYFAHMQDFIEPNRITSLSCSACIGGIDHGKVVHTHILRSMSESLSSSVGFYAGIALHVLILNFLTRLKEDPVPLQAKGFGYVDDLRPLLLWK